MDQDKLLTSAGMSACEDYIFLRRCEYAGEISVGGIHYGAAKDVRRWAFGGVADCGVDY